MKFVHLANLPKSQVKSVIVSDADKNVITSLENIGIQSIVPPRAKYLPQTLSYHTDMILLHLGNNLILCSEFNADFHELVISLGLSPTYLLDKLGKTYPYDVLLNVCFISNKIICNTNTCDKSVVTFALNNGYEIIDVKQGYSKCSVAVVDENSIITSDAGIYKATQKAGIDCLLICPGHIALKGFDYGFIGGCCGKIAQDKLFFTGDINSHPDANKIIDFLQSKNINVVCAQNDYLVDIGGILPIIEH